jgi:hypothetical protein
MGPADRAGYAARQADLLDALIRGDAYPDGFDTAHADAAGEALRHKRSRAIGHAWPALAGALGGSFESLCDAFVRARTTSGDGLSDGRAFVSWLADGGDDGTDTTGLVEDDDVRVEILLAGALRRRRPRSGVARRRRGVFVGQRRLHDPQRLVVVIRMPWIGVRIVCVPLGRTPVQ